MRITHESDNAIPPNTLTQTLKSTVLASFSSSTAAPLPLPLPQPEQEPRPRPSSLSMASSSSSSSNSSGLPSLSLKGSSRSNKASSSSEPQSYARLGDEHEEPLPPPQVSAPLAEGAGGGLGGVRQAFRRAAQQYYMVSRTRSIRPRDLTCL